MRNWRVLVAIAAVVLAGAAAYLSYEYAHKADTRAEKNVQQVDVLVAKGDISKGTTAAQALNSGLISTKHVPRGVLPPNAVVRPSPIVRMPAMFWPAMLLWRVLRWMPWHGMPTAADLPILLLSTSPSAALPSAA